jgi:hypothetical protein
MAAAFIDALVHVSDFLRQLAVNVHQKHPGIPQHGIHRRAQLMAHTGQELGLVLTRQFQLTPFLLNLAEKPRIVDRQRGLSRKSLQEVHHLRFEFPALSPPNRQGSHDLLFAEQRH